MSPLATLHDVGVTYCLKHSSMNDKLAKLIEELSNAKALGEANRKKAADEKERADEAEAAQRAMIVCISELCGHVSDWG